MEYIEPSDLLKLMQSSYNVGIVDVRDDDFITGNIPGCINIPSSKFMSIVYSSPEELEKQLSKFQTLVFHCALSQQRGPKAASRYLELIGKKLNQRVVILRGGFSAWQSLYKDTPGLVINHDKKYWEDPY